MTAYIKYSEIEIGRTATFAKTISEHDVYAFAGITGDFNPVHINAEYAKGTRFGERVAHGMLAASLISTVLGTILPGPGTIYLGQELKFTAPVKIGDTVTIRIEATEKRDDKRIVKFKTQAFNQEERMVLDGVATVIAPE
ncbi:MAG: MaoC family dehydratase [Myxococcota bacterium]